MTYAIVFGGNSYEHEISIVSAIVLSQKINQNQIFIFCDANREFYLINKNNLKSSFFANGDYKNEAKLTLKNGGFFTQNGFLKKEQKINFDIAINIIHGNDGEDGKIAGLFDFFGVKYIGPRLDASVISFDKELTKIYAKSVGVKTLEYQTFYSGDKIDEKIKEKLPVILKPARLGSSIGINIINDEKDLEYAFDSAFEYDEKVILEPFCKNIKEYNLAGFFDGEKIVFSMIEEPQKKEFLDFEQKYMTFSDECQIKQANIDKTIEICLKKAFEKIYLPLFKGALIRCDFFVSNDEVYLNEINPNPGSLANYLFDDFNDKLNALAKSIKSSKTIKIDYSYIKKINQKSGKLQ